MGWVISLGIECRRERQDLGGAKLDTEAAALAALDRDGDGAFGHLWAEEHVDGHVARWQRNPQSVRVRGTADPGRGSRKLRGSSWLTREGVPDDTDRRPEKLEGDSKGWTG